MMKTRNRVLESLKRWELLKIAQEVSRYIILLNRSRTAKRCREASGQAWGTMGRRIFKTCGCRRFNQQQAKDKGVEPQGLQNMEGEEW